MDLLRRMSGHGETKMPAQGVNHKERRDRKEGAGAARRTPATLPDLWTLKPWVIVVRWGDGNIQVAVRRTPPTLRTAQGRRTPARLPDLWRLKPWVIVVRWGDGNIQVAVRRTPPTLRSAPLGERLQLGARGYEGRQALGKWQRRTPGPLRRVACPGSAQWQGRWKRPNRGSENPCQVAGPLEAEAMGNCGQVGGWQWRG